MGETQLLLSERLIQLAEYLPKGARFADIGSDHAYLPCYVCLRDESALAVAGEVNKGPFQIALQNVRRYGLEERISVRLGDGLDVIDEPDEVRQIVIAGMGGGLISDILEKGKAKLSPVSRCILQPNTNARRVRIWLHEHGFSLVKEELIEEKGHIYEVLVADRGEKSPYTEQLMDKQLLFGPFLLEGKSAIFRKKWKQEQKKLEQVTEQMKQAAEPDVTKIRQFRKELTWIKEELSDG